MNGYERSLELIRNAWLTANLEGVSMEDFQKALEFAASHRGTDIKIPDSRVEYHADMSLE